MSTLVKESSNDNWNPTLVKDIRDSLVFCNNYPIKSNIAYSFQYLEYLDKQIEELALTSVITKMVYKTYVITGMAIIEAIFYLLLKERDLLDKDCWINLKKYISNEITTAGKQTRIVSQVQEKTEKFEKQVNFDYLIDKIEKKKLLKLHDVYFSVLGELRKLRNKIHIYISKDSDGTDYNSFNRFDYLTIRVILCKILTQDNITKKNEREYLKKNFKNSTNDWLEEFERIKN